MMKENFNPLPSFIPGWENLAAIGAGIGTGIINRDSQRETNYENARMAADQRAWEQMMSGTAHQREVSDLKKAGLNPILSAGGNGASTPSQSPATMQAPMIQMPNIFEAINVSQNQQRIDNEKALQSANIAKMLTDQELTKAKTVQEKLIPAGKTLSDQISKDIRDLSTWARKQTLEKLLKKQKSYRPDLNPAFPGLGGSTPEGRLP